jgi:hypothetical protein
MEGGNSGGTPIRCAKCHDVIQSMYRHDFKFCECGAIFVDGGNDYLRMGGELESIQIKKDGQWVNSEEEFKNNE